MSKKLFCANGERFYAVIRLKSIKAFSPTAVTNSGTGTWDVGRGRGTWDAGTWDAGTRGRGHSGTWGRVDAGTRRRVGIRGRDKQIAPDFCAELVKYFF